MLSGGWGGEQRHRNGKDKKRKVLIKKCEVSIPSFL